MRKIILTLICLLMVCGCSSKKNDDNQGTSTPTPTPEIEETVKVHLSDLLPEKIEQITIYVETSTEKIEIELKEEEIQNVLNQLKQTEVSENFREISGSGAVSYRLTYTDSQGKEEEVFEQGNVLRMADGTRTLSQEGILHELVMSMDWVIEISSYEMLTPLRIETDDYIITCEKGKTPSYDLSYLKDVGFDPIALGFSVYADGTDMAFAKMPEEGDFLLILTKDHASYQLKVTSSVK